MGKTIAFYGMEKGDFPYYVAKSLASNDFNVAAIDNSYKKDLFESVHQYADDDLNIVEKENIVFLKNAVVDESFINKFDYVIFYFGENQRTVSTDISFIVISYTMCDVAQVLTMDNEVIDDSYFILRDKVSNKVTEKGIAEDLGINMAQILGFVGYDIRDVAGYQNLTFEGRQRIKELSDDMQYAVMTVLSIITGDDLTVIRKYYKKAKRNIRF